MPLGPFAAETDETARRLVEINVHGVLHGMKEALARMQPRGRGQIVNIASTAAKVGFAGGATYSGTKHFVVGVSESVRAELRDAFAWLLGLDQVLGGADVEARRAYERRASGYSDDSEPERP